MSDTFIKEWNAEFGEVKQDTGQAVVNAAIYGWNMVTAKTPVRTGRARSSWNLTVDYVDDSTVTAVTPYPKDKGTGRVYGDERPPSIEFNIESNQKVFISNNVEYARYLEEGTDKMAPFSMVSSSIPAINNKLTRELSKVK